LLYAIAALIIIIPIFLYVFAGHLPNEFLYNNHHSIHINSDDIQNLSGFFILAILAGLVIATAFIVEIVLVIIQW